MYILQLRVNFMLFFANSNQVLNTQKRISLTIAIKSVINNLNLFRTFLHCYLDFLGKLLHLPSKDARRPVTNISCFKNLTFWWNCVVQWREFNWDKYLQNKRFKHSQYWAVMPNPSHFFTNTMSYILRVKQGEAIFDKRSTCSRVLYRLKNTVDVFRALQVLFTGQYLR